MSEENKTAPESPSSAARPWSDSLQVNGNIQPPPIYRVRDWATLFENSRSRSIDELRWVLVPNKHDSDGYCFVMAHEQPTVIYTAWILTLQIASRCNPRGTLILADGSPHTPDTLAMRTHGKREWFEVALPFLASQRIGWLEIVDPTACQPPVRRVTGDRQPHANRTTLARQPNGSHVTIEGNGREENGKGEINKSAPPLSMAEKISLERELERIGTELSGMAPRSEYPDGSRKQKRFDELTARRIELRQKLGVVA